VVADLSRSFDEFWNCALAIPQPALGAFADMKARGDDEVPGSPEGFAKLARHIVSGEPLRGLLRAKLPLAWGRARVVADPPEKAQPGGEGDGSPTSREIATQLQSVERDLVVISPYFVPGEDGFASFRRMRENGVRVRVLTNSLASTDVPAVHAGYRLYRQPLVDAGVEIHEVRPVAGQHRSQEHATGSSGSGASLAPFALHAKAFVFDRTTVFLGSANLDPRSRTLNTEVGIVIESPELAAQIIDRFDAFASESKSYNVTVDASAAERPLRWSAVIDGERVQWSEEPETTPEQRLHVDLLSVMPIEPLL